MGLANRIAGVAAILIGLAAPPAQAGYVVDLTQAGGNVVATGSGAIDLTGLSFLVAGGASASIGPRAGLIFTGVAIPEPSTFDEYTGITGPASFGSGDRSLASSGGGDLVGIYDFRSALFVPAGYASGGSLLDTSTYSGKTFATLGVTPGAYKWTWGTGPDQNFTLVATIVPEPATWAMMLLGFTGLGFMGYSENARRRRRTAF